jgi:hypothetical protein
MGIFLNEKEMENDFTALGYESGPRPRCSRADGPQRRQAEPASRASVVGLAWPCAVVTVRRARWWRGEV